MLELRSFSTSIVCCTVAAAFTVSSVPAAPASAEILRENISTLLASAKLEGGEKEEFSKAFLGAVEWQHELLDSGPVGDAEASLRILYGIWKSDTSLASRKVDRQMATACALEAPGRKFGLEEMLPRYEFFTEKWKYGLLNTGYAELSVFQRRYLAKGVQHTGLNSLQSMQYQNEEVCLPAEQYTGACWYAAYQLHSPFGDSIHGPQYYTPFMESWDNYAEVIKNVGGVCGSLSNFGASAAIANGIPAVTMGEPGHCAYAVMTSQGNWQPAYSLSWKRGMHTSFFGNTWGWHMLNTKAQEDPAAMAQSGDLRRLARYELAQKNVALARETIRKARTSFPLDAPNWAESIAILTESGGNDADWQTLYKDLIKTLAPVSGEIAFHFLKSDIYAKILPQGGEKEELRKNILLSFHQASTDWGLGRWDFGAALKAQLDLLSADMEKQDAFMAEVFAVHAAKNIFTGEILAAQVEREGEDEKRFQRFVAIIGKSLERTRDGEATDVIDTLAAKLLPSAAERGDKATFQFIGKLTAKNHEPLAINPEKFPGTLLSSGGTFSIQKPGNRWDNPSQHWGVIEEHGGDFHTDTTPAIATVQLGDFGKLTGVVIVTRGGNIGRLNGAVLQTSMDGTAWTDVHIFTNVSQIQRIDLAEKDITAAYVRVMQPAHGSLHFHKFLVYGQKQN